MGPNLTIFWLFGPKIPKKVNILEKSSAKCQSYTFFHHSMKGTTDGRNEWKGDFSWGFLFTRMVVLSKNPSFWCVSELLIQNFSSTMVKNWSRFYQKILHSGAFQSSSFIIFLQPVWRWSRFYQKILHSDAFQSS